MNKNPFNGAQKAVSVKMALGKMKVKIIIFLSVIGLWFLGMILYTISGDM